MARAHAACAVVVRSGPGARHGSSHSPRAFPAMVCEVLVLSVPLSTVMAANINVPMRCNDKKIPPGANSNLHREIYYRYSGVCPAGTHFVCDDTLHNGADGFRCTDTHSNQQGAKPQCSVDYDRRHTENSNPNGASQYGACSATEFPYEYIGTKCEPW